MFRIIFFITFFYSYAFATQECSDVFKKFQSEASQITDFYNANVDRYNQVFKDRTEDNIFIEKFLKLQNYNRLLDAGTGSGRFIPLLKRSAKKITGIDISDEMLKDAQKRYPDVEFLNMDISKIELPDSSFDGIASIYSLIHLPKTALISALREFHRVLTKRGKLFISLQEGSDDTIQVTSPISGKTIYVTLFSRSEVIYLLQNEGFRILSVESREHLVGIELPFLKLYIIAEKL